MDPHSLYTACSGWPYPAANDVPLAALADMAIAPCRSHQHDRLSQLCQGQIFFTLLIAVILKSQEDSSKVSGPSFIWCAPCMFISDTVVVD
jgi:hypothetical protein